MKYTKGSPIAFIPDSSGAYVVTYTVHLPGKERETWVAPLIGWAVVVRVHDDDTGETDTDIEPVTLDENGDICTTTDVRREYDPGTYMSATITRS